MSSSNSGDFVGGLQDAIRESPVSAALVGLGLLWMFTGGDKLKAAAALLGPAARSVTSGAMSGVHHSVDAISKAGDGIQSLGTQVSNSVQETVGNAASAVGDAASRTLESIKGVSDSTSRAVVAHTPSVGSTAAFGGTLQENLKQTLERQPLLLGAIGIAIGAGMAAAFPTTKTEQDIAGQTADSVIAQVKDAASSTATNVSAAASRTLEAVKQEADAQGLTVQAAKEGAAAIGEKVKSIAQAAGAKPSSRS
jgi:hypothetical protein